MRPDPARFAAAAEALVGSPYRLHGRLPTTGIDCVGLVTCALEHCGGRVAVPHGYGLRNSAIDRFLHLATANGFRVASGEVARGDLLLVAPGPAQQHLLVASGPGQFIHAHAGLRRVVLDHGLTDAPLLHHWRLLPHE